MQADSPRHPNRQRRRSRTTAASRWALARKNVSTMSISLTDRDARGRFAAGNHAASAGGRARAAKLSKRRRRAIARKGYRAMVARHFGGDSQAQKKFFGELGIYNSERVFEGTPIRVLARHPGPIQDWRARYYTDNLFAGAHRDVDFYGTANRSQESL